jgi:hypothetical protein
MSPKQKATRKEKKQEAEDIVRMPARLPGPLTELLIIGIGNITHPGTRHR